MMDELRVFENAEFGQLRVIEIDNEPWFLGTDVAKALQYSDKNKAVSMHVDEEDKKVLKYKAYDNSSEALWDRDNDYSDKTVINESGLYTLVLSSQLPSAKKFKRWITSEVIPSIRKNGGYIANQEGLTPEQIVANALIVAQNIISNQKEQLQKAEEKIASDAPLVDFATQVSQSADTVDMNEMAKLAADEGINIGRNRLIKWLKQNDVLMDDNLPYQKYIDRGYFQVVEVSKKTVYKDMLFHKTVVTGKGQIWLINKIKEHYAKEN